MVSPAANTTVQPSLGSNNPFRNRANSPSTVPASSYPFIPPQPIFTQFTTGTEAPPPYYPPQQQQPPPPQPALPQQQPFFPQQQQQYQPPPLSLPVDLFADLSIHEHSISQPPGPSSFQENLPPAASFDPSPSYTNTASLGAGYTAPVGVPRLAMPGDPSFKHSEPQRKRDPPSAPVRSTKDKEPSNQELLIDIFADPEPRSSQPREAVPQSQRVPRSSRPRRNSDTSIMEHGKGGNEGSGNKGIHGPREERSRQQRDQRERHHRNRPHRTREGERREGRPRPRPDRTLDIIDKLDITGIYGSAQFHHDGPYDACNPYRNRKGVRAPPIQAFADESTAMSPAPLKRGDDTKEKFDYNLYHGHIEKSLDFANESLTPAGTYKPKKDDLTGFDPASRVEPVHGEESMGLGTSTFLEGAPASRAAIGTHERERRSSHDGGYADGWNSNSGGGAGGGLTRKKSLAQKIRGGITRGTSTREPPRPINHKVTTSSSSDELALPTVKTGKGPSVSFNDDELDRKGGSTQITALDKGNSDGPGSSSGPNRHNGNGGGNGGVGNGLLSRVKSLRKR